MKKYLYLMFLLLVPDCLYAQQTILGTVHSAADAQPLEGASVLLKSNGSGTQTDARGAFSLSVSGPVDTLQVYLLGYRPQVIPLVLPLADPLQIELAVSTTGLQEVVVVSTGYQEIPQERATGSFTHVDSRLLNRSTGPDIISRLEGITNSLAFDRRGMYGERTDSRPELRVRGLSTIYANSAPLIVVDNFPYEGDIRNINPNDVESITVLKDAAAASIWGARAGNGVIVITTKRGKYNQPVRVGFSSSVQLTEKPDLFYGRDFLPAAEFLEVERMLFEQGFYPENERATLSPAVETWIQLRDGQLSEAEAQARIASFASTDVRREALQHLYRPALNQQYALNVKGGGEAYRYYLSAGLDKNLSTLIGNDYNRITLNGMNTFRPLDKLELSAGMAYTRNNTATNGLGISNLGTGDWSTIYPYARLADAEGNALPLLRDYRSEYVAQAESMGLLNWQYRPLEEIRLADNTETSDDLRLNAAANYRLLPGLTADAKYQYQHVSQRWTNLYMADSYYARDLVNRFTQPDGERIIPEGGILHEGVTGQAAHSGRLQLNYNHTFGETGVLTALGGAEVRQHQVIRYPGARIYGYDVETAIGQASLDYSSWHKTLPTSSAKIPGPASSRQVLTDRFLSYYANASYVFRDRYTLSASSRWDASNLYGVKTNQKGVPLWSAGVAWQLSKEPFFDFAWLPSLKLRATYGVSGNTDKSVTAYPTVSFAASDMVSRLRYALLRSAGNPQLRWEKAAILNLGLDFGMLQGRISGSMEYYHKKGTDLLGENFIDPTSGIISGSGGFVRNRVNYADVLTRGVDMNISTKNIAGSFTWDTDVLFSYVRNEVTNYMADETPTISGSTFFSSMPPPVVGKPIDAVYSYRWYGLSPDTGDPLVPVDDELGTDYTAYQRALTPGDLQFHGSATPTLFGALRNTFTWKQLSLSANITWKGGYYFRRSSIRYDSFYAQGQAHVDYRDRWQQSGDEQHTTVPSSPGTLSARRENQYAFSEVLVERGDHIRLQDINLGYTLTKQQWQSLPVQDVRLFLYARDLGILWRANGFGLDPDYVHTTYPPARSMALGLQVNF